MSDEDGYIVCVSCGERFYFSRQLRDKFARESRQLPRRCATCRPVNQARHESWGETECDAFADLDRRRALYRRNLKQQRSTK